MTNNKVTTVPSIDTLARMADTRYPDTDDGRGFLTGIYESVCEAVTFDPEQDPGDATAEIADSAIPVYTADLWRTFVDLAAWTEDPAEIGMDGRDMLKAAQGCLYLIASRLAWAAWEDITAEADDGDDDDESDDTED